MSTLKYLEIISISLLSVSASNSITLIKWVLDSTVQPDSYISKLEWTIPNSALNKFII